MLKQFRFTEAKFTSLPLKQQHKKCAEFLAKTLEDQNLGAQNNELLLHYTELLTWMGLTPTLFASEKELLDRYHYHMNEAGQQLKEHRLFISKGDKSDGLPFLPIAIYLDNLRSAANIGNILRTVEAFRLGEVYFSPSMATIENHKVKKSSMNAADWVKCHTGVSIDSLPRPLIAVETAPNAPSYKDFSFPERFTLAFGNEEYGLSDEILKKADHIIQIPLFGRKNSLNVSNAFAIIAQEVRTGLRKSTAHLI